MHVAMVSISAVSEMLRLQRRTSFAQVPSAVRLVYLLHMSHAAYRVAEASHSGSCRGKGFTYARDINTMDHRQNLAATERTHHGKLRCMLGYTVNDEAEVCHIEQRKLQA
jgi:hypothetical protein